MIVYHLRKCAAINKDENEEKILEFAKIIVPLHQQNYLFTILKIKVMKKMFFMMLAFMLTMSMSMFLFIIHQTPAKRSGFVMLGNGGINIPFCLPSDARGGRTGGPRREAGG